MYHSELTFTRNNAGHQCTLPGMHPYARSDISYPLRAMRVVGPRRDYFERFPSGCSLISALVFVVPGFSLCSVVSSVGMWLPFLSFVPGVAGWPALLG